MYTIVTLIISLILSVAIFPSMPIWFYLVFASIESFLLIFQRLFTIVLFKNADALKDNFLSKLRGLAAFGLTWLLMMALLGSRSGYFRDTRFYQSNRATTTTISSATPIASSTNTPPARTVQSVESLVNEGVEKYHAEDYESAIISFNKVIEQYPTCAICYTWRGLVYHDQGNYELALQDATSAIKLDPEQVQAHYLKGTALRSLGKPSEAVDSFSNAIEHDSTNATIYYSRGQSYFEVEKYTEALLDFMKVIDIGDRSIFADAYLYMSMCNIALDNQSEALRYIDLCLSSDPSSSTRESALYLKSKLPEIGN